MPRKSNKAKKSKGVKHRRRICFKKGHVPFNKGIVSERNNVQKSENRKFIRLTRDQYVEAMPTNKIDNALAPVLLRPLASSKLQVEQCAYPSEIKG